MDGGHETTTFLHPFTQQQFGSDQPSFNSLAQAHIIRDEEIHPRKSERFVKRLQLIGIHVDARAEG